MSAPETAAQLEIILREQRTAFASDRFPDCAERRRRLTVLENLLLTHADDLANAISADFGHRAAEETRLLEFFPTLQGIRYVRSHLGWWQKPERRSVSKWLLVGRSEVRYQPLGVIGIAAPWNYPLYLTLGPLTDALAAGNRVMVKPSEHSPRYAALLGQLVEQCFRRDLVHVVQGGLDVARVFTALPFDHLVFTGSTGVGREVMAAAARNLTGVTLELGGKSPAIIGPQFDLDLAAQRILFGKLVNAGQTCVAPDYVLVPQEHIASLVERLRVAARTRYGAAPDQYTSIAHESHHGRLLQLLEDARAQGARIEPLLEQQAMPPPRRLAPVVVLDAHEHMRLMREEIFGPILPIVPYRTLDEAIEFVNARDRPLALYVFENDARRRERILASTLSGGVTVNDTLLHAAQASLPFGGVGPSGIGRYHGLEGFQAMSHVRAVFRQRRFNWVPLFYPPYGRRARTLLKAMMRW